MSSRLNQDPVSNHINRLLAVVDVLSLYALTQPTALVIMELIEKLERELAESEGV